MSDRARAATAPPATEYAPTGAFASFAVPGYPALFASGWCTNIARWLGMFSATYLVNRLTGAPLLVQLVGTAFFAPMLLGGVAGGLIADRFDRRRTLLAIVLALLPLALLVGLLDGRGVLRAWMLYPFVFALGIANMLDLTARRALVFEMVGPGRLTNAMALESMTQTGGALVGTLGAGALITAFGTSAGFLAVAVAYGATALCLLTVPRPARPAAAHQPTTLRRDIAEGFRYVRRHRPIIGVLGVTALFNLFVFPYSPLVPVFADKLGVNAFWAGALAASSGVGALLCAFAIASGLLRPLRRGALYTLGTGLGMVGVLLFAVAPWYPLALLALVLTGMGQAAFATMQGTLMLVAAEPAMRGRVMGIVSMVIGVLPLGMTVLGLTAQALGPTVAVGLMAASGLVALTAWSFAYRETSRLA